MSSNGARVICVTGGQLIFRLFLLISVLIFVQPFPHTNLDENAIGEKTNDDCVENFFYNNEASACAPCTDQELCQKYNATVIRNCSRYTDTVCVLEKGWYYQLDQGTLTELLQNGRQRIAPCSQCCPTNSFIKSRKVDACILQDHIVGDHVCEANLNCEVVLNTTVALNTTVGSDASSMKPGEIIAIVAIAVVVPVVVLGICMYHHRRKFSRYWDSRLPYPIQQVKQKGDVQTNEPGDAGDRRHPQEIPMLERPNGDIQEHPVNERGDTGTTSDQQRTG